MDSRFRGNDGFRNSLYTSFQLKVWRACLDIPKGQVRSYGWIAKRIGHPGAARAVGSALAKNPFAPRVPCHRVIRKNGQLGRYSGPGGIKTKRHLLIMEGVRLKKITP
ncbi:MAG: MGMT family protein [Elusimicrobia bacterium]|nr:MGMT family protein [Candidatus Obscuribacterium magneticum]